MSGSEGSRDVPSVCMYQHTSGGVFHRSGMQRAKVKSSSTHVPHNADEKPSYWPGMWRITVLAIIAGVGMSFVPGVSEWGGLGIGLGVMFLGQVFNYKRIRDLNKLNEWSRVYDEMSYWPGVWQATVLAIIMGVGMSFVPGVSMGGAVGIGLGAMFLGQILNYKHVRDFNKWHELLLPAMQRRAFLVDRRGFNFGANTISDI